VQEQFLSKQQLEERQRQKTLLDSVLKQALKSATTDMQVFKDKKTRELVQLERKEKGKQMLSS